MADAVGEGNNLAVLVEEVLDAGAGGLGGGDGEDVVLLGGADGVVIEVVDDKAGAVGGEGDVKLGQEAHDGGRDGRFGGEGQKDVALGVDELEENVGGQVGTETWRCHCKYRFDRSGIAVESHTLALRGEEQNVVVDTLAELEQLQRLALGRLVRDAESAA